VLRLAPSSVNSQPWHFIMVSSDAGKGRIAELMQGGFAYNASKVRNASHLIILCACTDLDDAHLTALLEQEDQDGRFATPAAKATQGDMRGYYVNLHRQQLKDVQIWAQKQVYLALGSLLLAAATLDVDACPMEGFDGAVLDEALGLSGRGLASLVMVALGYRSADDFNAALPKSRLPESMVFTDL
jgi:nitroreductase / dihydropteridine reductase